MLNFESKRRFDTNLMIFIPEIISKQGEQSVLDFIQHAPVQKTLNIFTVISNEETIQNIQANLDKLKRNSQRKIMIYRVLNFGPDIENKINNIQEGLNQNMNQN